MTAFGRISLRARRGRRYRRGQAAIELAIVALPALILLFAITQLGIAVYTWNSIDYATRCAARYAMVHGANSVSPATSNSVQSYVDGLVVGLDPSALSVTTTWTPDNNPGSSVKIQVQYNFNPVAPFVSSLTLPLSSTAVTTITN